MKKQEEGGLEKAPSLHFDPYINPPAPPIAASHLNAPAQAQPRYTATVTRPGQHGSREASRRQVYTPAPPPFAAHETAMPKPLHAQRDKAAVYRTAHQANDSLAEALDRGRGLSARHGMDVSHPGQGQEHRDALQARPTGHLVMLAPLKGERRAAEKAGEAAREGEARTGVKQDPARHYHAVTDIARATVAAEHHGHLAGIIGHAREHLEAQGFTLARVKEQHTAQGYRGLLTNWRHGNGHVAEVQFLDKHMLHAKEQGHKHYEATRRIEEKYPKGTPPSEFSPRDRGAHLWHRQKQVDLYHGAWQDTLHSRPRADVAAAEKGVATHGDATLSDDNTPPPSADFSRPRYYDFDGTPAVREDGGRLPLLYYPEGRTRRFHSVAEFERDAEPVAFARFQEMLDALR